MLTDCLRELLALGQTNVETVIRKSFEDAGLETDRLSQALAATMNHQHQDLLALHNNHQTALTLKLESNQQVVLSNQSKHGKALSITQRTQVGILRRQDASMEVARRTQQQTSSILQTMTCANARAVEIMNASRVIITDLASDVKQLLSLNDSSLLVNQSDREISFLGQYRERIIAYLLPFQDDVDFAIKCLISQHSEDISQSDADFLRSEFQHLIDSAVQEKALQHPNSTAKSLDKWVYPEDTVVFFKNLSKKRKVQELLHQYNNQGESSRKRAELPRKRQKQWSRTCTVQTSSGPMDISLPHSQGAAGEEPQNAVEVGISYTVTQNRSSVHVNAHFLRKLAYAGEARICAQLNIFTLVDEDVSARYDTLFQNVSLSEFDVALRQGTISSFHMDYHGDNLCLYVS
jgi:hypothetical protein